jgi:prevent-host-death family protein
MANCINRVMIKRPLVITQHGKDVAVLLDVHEYEALQEKIEILTDI